MLLGGPISHLSIQYMNFSVLLNLPTILLISVGVELPVCMVVILPQNALICFLEPN